MKKYMIFPLLLAAAITFSCGRGEPVSNDGIVQFMLGSVSVEYRGAGVTPVQGDAVKEGSVVVTGNRSIVNIAYGENIIRVMENSTVAITKALVDRAAGTEQSEFSVRDGKLFARVGKKLSRGDLFLVKTPTTVASVRGTNFLISTSKGKSSVSCLNGTIEVKKADDPDAEAVEVKDGQGITLEIGKEIEMKELSDDEIAMMLDILERIESGEENTVPLSNRPIPEYDSRH
ncbi:MAG: FecR domain-containing protein [Spirochaetes bacterium]|nr:FecR domain-containing protein [Spirochaetota bacterium]